MVDRTLRDRIGKSAGDRVILVLDRDERPVRIQLPAAFREALRAAPRAKAFFASLAPSHRRAFATWVGEAKRSETRDRRARQAVRMLQLRRTLR